MGVLNWIDGDWRVIPFVLSSMIYEADELIIRLVWPINIALPFAFTDEGVEDNDEYAVGVIL